NAIRRPQCSSYFNQPLGAKPAPPAPLQNGKMTPGMTPMTGAGTNRTKPSRGGGPAIILVRPQLAVNIGMCARAMANFGLDDLRLVAPREAWPASGVSQKAAYAAAAGGEKILEALRLFETVEQSVLDLNFLWATTARERDQFK